MPRYDIENTIKIGKPCQVFDANNDEILWVVSCDTETGEVERLEHDGQSFVTDEEGYDINRIIENRPAPLYTKWCEPNYCGENDEYKRRWR